MPERIFPVIPEQITVHLGTPEATAENVTVPFTDYIKNVASSEIYPTWPEAALRANIYAIITFALNRIYTEWYASRGYDFDITNSTQFDQAFVKNRDYFENISRIVDEIFNDYIVRENDIQPLFSRFCNGTTSKCDGLSQWGSVTLAESGFTPFRILQNYYGDDIRLVENAPVAEIEKSYPQVPLRLGTAGNDVKIIQTQLNRISRNYPAIPKIANENGIFGTDTEAAVRRFQEIFNLTVTGTVDKSTWYRIKQYYVGVKNLSELVAEGITLEEAALPYSTVLSEGMTGVAVSTLQYYLNIIAYFNPNLNLSPLDGYFGPATTAAVREFQQFYGLTVTGIVKEDTWRLIDKIYIDTVGSLPSNYSNGRAKLYPGYFLTEGMQGESVRDLQTYLSEIAKAIPEIPEIPVTGYFGTQTRDAVYTFQRLFGLLENGAVGPVTWYTIAREYDNILFPADSNTL